ncbi:MAG: hypothetical protein MJ180_05995 [Candidatus Gastranaerophilales bacterium]|nr:hypothetical protein [Candidatus Gastranaerophilales bacterium]
MQVNQLSVTNNYRVTNNKNINNRQQSFKGGGFLSCLGNANKGLMHFVERGGFFAEFCIMDMLGLVLPRVWQGFHRNKEELGHLNYQAGMEELLRESITGPSMFLIPIGAVILAGRMLGKATQIPTHILTKFSETFKSTAPTIVNQESKDMQKTFAGKLFDDLFTNAKDKLDVKNPAKTMAEYKQEFVSQLTDSIGTKFKWKEGRIRIDKFNDLIANINATFFDHAKRENTFAIPFSVRVRTSKDVKEYGTVARDLYEFARKYMEDVIPSTKLSIEKLTTKNASAVENIIRKLTEIRLNGRELLCIGGTAALAAFLSIIPRIYQLSKKNPALNGLEENKQEVSKC